MNGGTVHAVLSPVNSVVGGIYLLDQEWIKTGSVESKIAGHFQKIEALIEDPSEDHENIEEILRNTEKVEVELWKRLRRNTADHDLIWKLEKLQAWMKEKIKKIRIIKDSERIKISGARNRSCEIFSAFECVMFRD